jgi:hypothetical protein
MRCLDPRFLRLDRGFTRLDHRSCRPFACFDGGPITTEAPYQFFPQVFLDQRFMNPFGQTVLGKFFEGPRECGVRRELLAGRKTTNPPQRPVYLQTLDQARRRRKSPHRFGYKGIGQPRPLVRRPPDATPRGFNKFFHTSPFQRVDDFLQFLRQHPGLCSNLRYQHVPALQDQVASRSIHFAGVMV